MSTTNNYSSFPMAIKTLLFFLVSLLSVLTRVVYAKVPPPAPVSIKAPPPPPPPPPEPCIAPVLPPVALPAPPPPTPPRNTKECYPLCVERCSLNSRKNICLRACVTCCDRCKCVPKGPYEKREVCGKCYANMTSRGKPKCP